MNDGTRPPVPLQSLADPGRRDVLKVLVGTLAAMLLPAGCRSTTMRDGSESATGASQLGWQALPTSTDDRVRLPAGYRHHVIYAWGDPVQPDGPSFRADAGNSAREQWQQAGDHHDGMEFFPIEGSATHGWLVMNHETFDDGLIHRGGATPPSAEKTEKGKACCGVSVLEVTQDTSTGHWKRVRSSAARRITAGTPMIVAGPAAGHPRMQTSADPEGTTILGTLGNCASGKTPWGTYLTCEENFQDFFKLPEAAQRAAGPEARYMRDATRMAQWYLHDKRFDFDEEPHEFNRFGWVVEIDPENKTPCVKRTALGRFRHENACVTVAADGRVVVYMGDDARFEYIYKFVSEGRWDPRRPESREGLLDRGTLYAARFDDDGAGRWLPLVHGENGLTAEAGFEDQAEVVMFARLAAERVGATSMDRPEWIVAHEQRGEVYATLTNNSKRGTAGHDAPDAANPRNTNIHGHIMRWRESGGDVTSERFDWDIFRLCGDGDDPAGMSSPDGLHIDGRGVLWVQTDVSTSFLNTGEYAAFGNNQIVAIDPASGDARRFMTGPVRCEITGLTTTPDGRTLFVNIQHPGQPDGGVTKDPAKVAQHSSWPDTESEEVRQGRPQCGRPRSATIVIQREDGGVIGAP